MRVDLLANGVVRWPAVTPSPDTGLAELLERAVALYRAHFNEAPPRRPEPLEDELLYLGMEVQVPIAEAIRFAGYEAFRDAVLAAMARDGQAR